MGLHHTPMCKYCPEKTDDAERTFFEYERWRDYKANTEAAIGKAFNPASLVNYMVQRELNWKKSQTTRSGSSKKKPQKPVRKQRTVVWCNTDWVEVMLTWFRPGLPCTKRGEQGDSLVDGNPTLIYHHQ
ncbi:unnamed protein product [Euphydryas editha]|uniref:Transposase n=1 Tax=Euphydryas editha TaxID=104508 RepID=A0AAU9TD05_EUPED|nr:unnamed protein product [Euphydryas editha]